MGEGYQNGLLNAGLKGRGLGDCVSTETYAWNGTEFVLAEEKDTGLCRGFPGGAWDFYRTTSEIRREKISELPSRNPCKFISTNNENKLKQIDLN